MKKISKVEFLEMCEAQRQYNMDMLRAVPYSQRANDPFLNGMAEYDPELVRLIRAEQDAYIASMERIVAYLDSKLEKKP